MPLVIPPFVAYQAPLVPISSRSLTPPAEGNRMIPVEIDWGVTVPNGLAVQLTLNAGPTEFSQIVAFSVDNGRNGADVSFIFPDTGRQLTVPAYSQGVYPVFTNAATFYVVSEAALAGDVSEFEILNFVPPAVSVLPSQEQSHAGTAGLDLGVPGTTQVISASAGTLQTIAITINETNPGATVQSAGISLQDGTGVTLWQTVVVVAPNSAQTVPITVPGLRLRFSNGVFVHITSISGMPTNECDVVVNLYYSEP